MGCPKIVHNFKGCLWTVHNFNYLSTGHFYPIPAQVNFQLSVLSHFE
ncbi:unnamed protein product [Staurois parvus]|uniref:Uncharacterized protein n=1 Tax=Staurois parvus TaxID=386267 RepID=A0ABN9BZ66_9NEOB|nr:unnamed protein product [Staurois parvus]